MTKQNKNKPLIIQAGADKSVIPAGKKGTRILEIRLGAPSAPADRPHVPLNLNLVLDRSGSMHGEKLQFAKEAALHVVSLMTEADRASVVIYDDKVETLMASQYLTPQVKQALTAKIRNVRTGGSTDLYGGWLAGSRQAAEALSETSFNRTLLLTDGLANVGVRDVGTLSMQAQELFRRGISTSCFGVGQDYDEHLLEAMSTLGGGNFHFLETTQAIPLVFEREFDEIISLVLRDVQISLILPEGVRAAVSGNLHSEREGERLTIFLGSLAADQQSAVYVTLSGLPGDSKDGLTIPVSVTGSDADQVEHSLAASVTLMPVPEAEESAQPQDADLMQRFAVVDLADKANEALKLERSGDRLRSSQLIRNSVQQHRPHLAQSTAENYQVMSDQMAAGLNEPDRKRHHFSQYESKRGRQAIRHYRLVSAQERLLVSIDGLKVLINTAAPLSIGKEGQWPFLEEVYRLAPSDGALTCEAVSKTIGERVDVMLGMDILQNLYVRIDPNRHVVEFSRMPLRMEGQALAMTMQGGIPAVTLPVDGLQVPMRLASGLRLSYVPAVLANAALSLEQVEDADPCGSAFNSPLYHLPLQLGNGTRVLRCGALPDAVRQGLRLKAGEGTLGAMFLIQSGACLAFPQGLLSLES